MNQHRAVHVVRPGETLSAIARHLGIDWHLLARMNAITNPSKLRVGAILRIPHATEGHRQTRPHTPAPELPAAPMGPIARPQAGGPRLGDLSMRYETGFRPGQEAQAAAVVSSGAGDAGGVSYGAYQLASSSKGGRQVQAFLAHDGTPWAAQFAGMDATESGGAFGTKWKEIASQQPQEFFAAQHTYIERTHYSPVVNYVKDATGLDVSTRSRSVQNAVWSMSVQHGKAASLVERAVNQAGPQGERSDLEYDRDLINALYDVRDDYVDALGLANLKARYTAERRDALQQLGAGS